MRPAYGDAFSGDVLLSAFPPTADRLEVAPGDVSGKGQDAGSRGLLLSGAVRRVAGVGSMPPHDFLPAANGYVLRQECFEGSATAVHVSLDLASGTVGVVSAWHPPAVHARAAPGRRPTSSTGRTVHCSVWCPTPTSRP